MNYIAAAIAIREQQSEPVMVTVKLSLKQSNQWLANLKCLVNSVQQCLSG